MLVKPGMRLRAARRVPFVYSLIHPHETLTQRHGSHCTPAMAAGILDRPLTFDDMVRLLDHPGN